MKLLHKHEDLPWMFHSSAEKLKVKLLNETNKKVYLARISF